MKNFKRIAAILGVVILLAVCCLPMIFAFGSGENSQGNFKAAVGSVILVPVLAYVFLMVYKLLKKEDKEAEGEVKNIIFDVGQVLVSYEWEDYLKSFHFPEEEEKMIAEAVFKSQTWNERDRGLFPEEEYLKQFIAALPAEYEEDVKRVLRESEKTIQIKDYAEDSIPVLTGEKELIGVITSQDLVEVVDDAMGEDYAKLAGLTAEEDLEETTKESMKKRLPWLMILLILGLGVSSVVGIFEAVVAVIPVVMCFQSLILDMAGNVGTQSLAVTIRVLVDENLTGKQKVHLVIKEMRVGLLNGLFLGTLAFIFIGLYVWIFKQNPAPHAFVISGCVGLALMIAMVISSLVGTLIPMFFHKINVDPAVASGPLITTVNDLVAVVTYYGLVWILLIHVLHLVG